MELNPELCDVVEAANSKLRFLAALPMNFDPILNEWRDFHDMARMRIEDWRGNLLSPPMTLAKDPLTFAYLKTAAIEALVILGMLYSQDETVLLNNGSGRVEKPARR